MKKIGEQSLFMVDDSKGDSKGDSKELVLDFFFVLDFKVCLFCDWR